MKATVIKPGCTEEHTPIPALACGDCGLKWWCQGCDWFCCDCGMGLCDGCLDAFEKEEAPE